MRKEIRQAGMQTDKQTSRHLSAKATGLFKYVINSFGRADDVALEENRIRLQLNSLFFSSLDGDN